MKMKRLAVIAAMTAVAVLGVTGCKDGIKVSADGSTKTVDATELGEVIAPVDGVAQFPGANDPERIALAKSRIGQIPVAEPSDGGVKYQRKTMYPTWEPAWPDWGWSADLPTKKDGSPQCDVREAALIRDTAAAYNPKTCAVKELHFQDPYTGKIVDSKSDLDIDHIVALNDAHRSGGWKLTDDYKVSLANDPDNVIPVLDTENQKEKSDKNAAEYLPPNEGIRCFYVASQTNIKFRYELSMTATEKAVIEKVLSGC